MWHMVQLVDLGFPLWSRATCHVVVPIYTGFTHQKQWLIVINNDYLLEIKHNLEYVLVFHTLGMIIPIDELIFFRGVGRVGIPPTRQVSSTGPAGPATETGSGTCCYSILQKDSGVPSNDDHDRILRHTMHDILYICTQLWWWRWRCWCRWRWFISITCY